MKRVTLVLALGFLTSCVVPLKVPPIKPGTENAPAIDWARLTEFAVAAGHAYDTTDVIEKTYGKKNVVVRDLPNSQVRYFIYYNHADKTQTIAVRGTANKVNAVGDIESIKVFDPKLKIFLHRGFLRDTDQLYEDAIPFLQKDYKTRITGHSLGGAIACILMMDLIHDKIPVDQVLTFGQPLVTNEQGGQEYANAPIFRIINDHDIVAQLPPSNVVYDLAGPYIHFGPEITLLPDKKWTYSPVHIPQDWVTNDYWKNLSFVNGTDHEIKNYIDRLKELK